MAPRGVDLNLDKFNLSSTTGSAGDVKTGSADLVVGQAFLAALHGDGGELGDEDRALFQQVFNPHLSDRAAEGDRFAPPPTSYSHLQSLKRLVKEEHEVREK